jgi:tetratricopeptide (TPR) repeat protein
VDLPQKTPAGTAEFPHGLSYRIFKTPPSAAQARGLLAESLDLAALIRSRPLPAGTDFFTRHTLAYWPSALNNLGVEAQRLGLNDEAVRIYRLALRAAPWLSESWNNWGNAAIALGDAGAAAGCYEASLRERPAPQVVYNLGRAYLISGRFEAAQAQFRKAIAAADIIDAHNDLGLIYLRSGKTDDAVREWLGVLQRNPGYAAAYYNLALAFQHLGRKEDAIRALARYRTLVGDAAGRRDVETWMQGLKK